MNSKSNFYLMVQVAKLYHEKNLTQEEVAQRLNITRQKVSRLLINAKSEGIVKTVVYDPVPTETRLGNEMKNAFNLHEVVLIPGRNIEGNQLRTGLGLAAADYLKRALQVDQNVGIGWGRTLYETITLIREGDEKRINVIPLIGGIGDLPPFYQVNELARDLANAFYGTYRFFYAPAFIEERLVLNKLYETNEITHTIQYWDKLDVAVIGIGHVDYGKRSSMFFVDSIPQQMSDRLKAEKAVGDICARFFDIYGTQVFAEPGIVGISLDQIKAVPEVIVIAGGKEKENAILGALRGGYIKTLITDEGTAHAVLAKQERKEEDTQLI